MAMTGRWRFVWVPAANLLLAAEFSDVEIIRLRHLFQV
jgi:hypothetical protein